jgi:hypothetical protein
VALALIPIVLVRGQHLYFQCGTGLDTCCTGAWTAFLFRLDTIGCSRRGITLVANTKETDLRNHAAWKQTVRKTHRKSLERKTQVKILNEKRKRKGKLNRLKLKPSRWKTEKGSSWAVNTPSCLQPSSWRQEAREEQEGIFKSKRWFRPKHKKDGFHSASVPRQYQPTFGYTRLQELKYFCCCSILSGVWEVFVKGLRSGKRASV